MGLFENLLQKTLGGATAKGADQGSLTSIIELINNNQGGAGGIVGKLKEGGLGDIVDSWIGTGKNKAVKSSQISNVLGSDLVGQLAGKLGISQGDAAKKIAQYLPMIVDKLTPQGKASSLNKSIDIQDILGSLLKK
jgi:uncharacterized protein YidB (DUF937 family)